jgi:SNF2 family DNA or RNA helicase
MIARLYQKVGTRFFTSRPGAILNDQVGLGKTATAVWAAQEAGVKTILVVCPLILKEQWQEEILKVLPGNADRAVNEAGLPVLTIGQQTWTFAHYEQFQGQGDPKEITAWLLSQQWDAVVLDEAHRVKNRKSQRAHWIKKLARKYTWLLTGTALADKAEDIWTLLHLVDPKEFPFFWPFVEAYYNFGPAYEGAFASQIDGIKRKQKQAWRERLQPYILARRLEDVGLELPPLTIIDVPLEVPADLKDFYTQVKKEIIIPLSSERNEFEYLDLSAADQLIITGAGARFTRLRQVTSAASVFKQGLSNPKAEWLKEFAEEGEPALVLCAFNHTVDLVKAEITRLGLKGWQVGTWDKMSEGLNLQHLRHLIAWDMPLSRKSWEQGLGREHRSGQTREVFIHRLYLKGTVDVRVRELIDHKQATITELLNWLRGIHDEEI